MSEETGQKLTSMDDLNRSIREKFGLKEGDGLKITVTDTTVVLEPSSGEMMASTAATLLTIAMAVLEMHVDKELSFPANTTAH